MVSGLTLPSGAWWVGFLGAIVIAGACAASSSAPEPTPATPSADRTTATTPAPVIHPNGEWLAIRAAGLGLDAATAKARDDAFAVAPPPDGAWWDQELAKESWAIWTALCRECHDGARSLAKVVMYPQPRSAWAQTEARFFAEQRHPQAVFAVIRDGAKAKQGKDMPGWNGKLTNEQMWGLVYVIGSASAPKNNDLR